MAKCTLGGIIAPLITPFTQDDQMDEALLIREIKLLAKAGVDGISPGGSTGEGAALTDDELGRAVELVKKHAPGVAVVAGVIRNSGLAAVSAAQRARAAGADALMVTPVSYNVLVPDDEGNLNYYRTIANAVDLPIVIYNVVPQNTITPALFRRMLAEIPGVVGIKQSCGGIAAFYAMKMECGREGLIFSATDDMLYSTYELGADGAISAILTVFPEICVDMWQAVRSGDNTRALVLQNRMYKTWQAIGGPQFPIRIKYALKLLGRDGGYPRNPICHISEPEKERIRMALAEGGFIN